MSVLLKTGDLIIGNGDLFLGTLGSLPTESAYKSALSAGTVGSLYGNVGAIKGTASMQLVRELAQFELGVPQLVADQTCIREGIMFKVQAAEPTLINIQQQIGAGLYSTVAAGSTHVATEAHTTSQFAGEFVSIPFLNGPVLNGSTTPTATAPVITSAGPVTYTLNTDYTIDYVNNTLTPVVGGAITNALALNFNYYYNAAGGGTETLTVGGQASVTTTGLKFIHPYKWGGVMSLTIYAANPAGTVTLPFEEIAYSHYEIEFKAIAVFTNGIGNQLYKIYRDIPTS